MIRNTVICDIDHTIANSFWRDPMVGGEWDKYHAASIDDEPLEDVVNLLRALEAAKYTIVGVTSRPQKWRKLTLDWLVKWDIPMHRVLMRPKDDFRPAGELKLDLIKRTFEDPLNEIAFVLDDRDDVVEAFRGHGLTALQVFGRAR